MLRGWREGGVPRYFGFGCGRIDRGTVVRKVKSKKKKKLGVNCGLGSRQRSGREGRPIARV